MIKNYYADNYENNQSNNKHNPNNLRIYDYYILQVITVKKSCFHTKRITQAIKKLKRKRKK